MHRISVTLISLLLAATSIRAENPLLDQGGVTRTQFTSAVQSREPVDNLTELSNGAAERIFCFTELSDMSGQIVSHNWVYRGEVMSVARFHIDKPHSRIWSSRLLSPEQPGSWTVVVLTATGEVLAERTLDYNLDEPAF